MYTKIVNGGNFEQRPNVKRYKPSLTKPDRSLTVAEILKRFANGMTVPGEKVPIYDPDDVTTWGIDPKSLDLVDIQQMRLENAEKIEQLKLQVLDERRLAAEAKEKLKKDEEDRLMNAAKRHLEGIDKHVNFVKNQNSTNPS